MELENRSIRRALVFLGTIYKFLKLLHRRVHHFTGTITLDSIILFTIHDIDHKHYIWKELSLFSTV